MKTVLVNVQLQFDLFENGSPDELKAKAILALHKINSVLQEVQLDSSPQIFVNAIPDSDIEIANDEFDDDDEVIEPELREAMIKSGAFKPVNHWSEIQNDHEDEGMIHIDAWTTEDGDESGKVIAKVSVETGEVTYLDERAKTDKMAQEAINEAIQYSTKKGL